MSTERRKVLLTEPVHPIAAETLEAGGCAVIEGWTLDDAGMADALAGIEAILVRIARVPSGMIEAAPKLRVIAKHGVGCDNIDQAEARARGVTLAVAADANARSVAEHTLMFILGLAKNLGHMDRAVRQDYSRRMQTRVVDVADKRVLVLGYGRIGKLVAPLCRAFGMEVLLHDLLLEPGTACDGFAVAPSLAEGLAQADFLTVHVPLTDLTRGIIGRAELASMKPGSFVVNCARGGIVDEAALAELTASGHLGGFASDVFSAEPIEPGNPLLADNPSLLTPHSAALSEEAVRRMAYRAARNILDHFEGQLAPEFVFGG
ncbi:MAG: hydroxyacid dehydrogenase [Paracoccaceae bacterium]|nr:hydroxyacid dehydrogenase [Paracoccaceae bacterium]